MSEPSSQAEPVVINDRCKCSHDRFRHNYDTADGPCSKPDCDCKAYAPVTFETVEFPESDDSDCTEDFRRARCYPRHTEDCPYVDPSEAPSKPEIGPLPPPEGPEYTPCIACGHIEPEHDEQGGHCIAEACDCVAYRTEFDARRAWAVAPQPERRPPLTVQYSVAGGHPYEVSIPGDASVTAEDGVLKIQHPSAQILAITRVAPMEG